MAAVTLRIPRPAGLGAFTLVHEIGTGMDDFVLTASGGEPDVRLLLEELFSELFELLTQKTEDTEGDRE